MADLFAKTEDEVSGASQEEAALERPLADRLRPTQLDDVIGQDHLLGSDAPLGVMLEAGTLGSLILWGPPGVGKTTIARLLAGATARYFVQRSRTGSCLIWRMAPSFS